MRKGCRLKLRARRSFGFILSRNVGVGSESRERIVSQDFHRYVVVLFLRLPGPGLFVDLRIFRWIASLSVIQTLSPWFRILIRGLVFPALAILHRWILHILLQ